MVRADETQLLHIIEKYTDGVAIVDNGGKVCFVNSAAEFLLGRKTEEILDGDLGFEITSDMSMEKDSVNGNGDRIIVEVRVADIEWEDSKAHLVSFNDITDRKKIEEELRSTYLQVLQHQKALIEEERLKVILQMADATAHELRQPLTSLLGNLDLLGENTYGTSEFNVCVKEIKKAGEKINDTIQKIQSVRRYDSKPYYDHLSIIDIDQGATILAIEDSDTDFIKLSCIIKSYGNVQLTRVKTFSEAHEMLSDGSFDLILMEYILPDGTGLEFLTSINEKEIDIPTVVISGQGDEVVASQLVKAGVYDYLIKADMSEKSVARVISNALEKCHLKKELQRTIQKMSEMATRDELTGLYNQQYLMDAMEREIATAQRYGKDVSLCMMEPDDLDKITDAHGGDARDMILKEFATIIDRNIRKSDLLCRYSKKEFGILLTCTDMKKARLFGERIKKQIKEQIFEFNFAEMNITISAGISTYSETVDQTPESLLEEASKALIQAREAGGDRVRILF